jgi:hypothetical protein
MVSTREFHRDPGADGDAEDARRHLDPALPGGLDPVGAADRTRRDLDVDVCYLPPVRRRDRDRTEASEAAWLAPKEASERMSGAFAIRVTDALRDGGPFIRVHDGTNVLQPERAGACTL